MPSDWTDAENDLIVACYFAMHRTELSGAAVNKAEENRRLQALLPGRSRGSIEYKHQNISAVLLELGETWVPGYKPAVQFQGSLVDAVLRWLDRNPDWDRSAQPFWHEPGKAFVSDAPALYIGPPPTFSNQPPILSDESVSLVARRIDVAERDARNKALGEAGEALVFHHEVACLEACNRSDLARRVIWASRDEGDGLGYDIASFEPDGVPRLIEVKTTNGWERTPFHITRTELAAAEHHRDTWVLYRLWNWRREPKAFAIRPPLDRHVALTPTSFLASLN